MSLPDLIPILQSAIGPVILVSGVGLLLLSMTNRYGRVIDRARLLTKERREGPAGQRASLDAQLSVLLRRARIIRAAIACGAVSVLLAAVLVISLFLGAILQWHAGYLVAGIFAACMLALIASLVLFLADINVSLHALKLEVENDGAG